MSGVTGQQINNRKRQTTDVSQFRYRTHSTIEPDTMETPLDVLSTLAASMAERTEKKGDPVLGCPTSLDTNYDLVSAASAAASSKDLPTRGLKGERVKERQDLTQVLHIDKEHAAAINARKTVTAATQTHFSSFNGEAPPYPGPPPGPPPAYFAPRGEAHRTDNYSPIHHHPLYGPPPPLPPPPPHPSSISSSSSSPPSSAHLIDLSSRSHGADVQNAPLNLSLSNSPLPVSSSLSSATSPSSAWQTHRASVITCMSSPSPVSSRSSSPRAYNGNGGGQSSPSGSNPPVSDPAIEEHFRRSLASYGDCAPKTSPSTTSAVEPNVSITGSVDDHFAKALGDSTWRAIKSQNDPSHEVFTGSVDDHFAKALGATTWRRIKAEKEHSDNSSVSNTAANNSTTNNNNNNNNNSPGHSSSSSSSPSQSSLSYSASVAT